MAGEKIADPAIEDDGAQDGGAAAPAAAVLFRVEVNRRQDLGRLRVPEQRPLPGCFPCPCRQRDEQRLLDRPKFRLHAISHTSHYTPASRAPAAPGKVWPCPSEDRSPGRR